jgi:hypothetical protein
MIVYVGAGSGKFRDLVIAAGHGQMSSRQASSFRTPSVGRWALDNGAWIDFIHREPFDNHQFLERIHAVSELPDDRLPDWCVVPDIVASRLSLPYSLRWRQALAGSDRRLRWYLAVQDFMTFEDVEAALCLEPFDGIFIGGSTPWKIATAEQWIAWGHDRELPVHLARINGPNWLQWAVNIGADSVDGTGWVKAGAKWLPYLQDVPKPMRSLFKGLRDIPENWVRFGIYLESIWSEKAWKGWSKSECPTTLSNPEEIRRMDPDEFLTWLEDTYTERPAEDADVWRRDFARMYIATARDKMPEFKNPEEIELWKRWVLWEVERLVTPTTPPPPPEILPRP